MKPTPTGQLRANGTPAALRSRWMQFARQSREHRTSSQLGAPMGEEQIKNWEAALHATDLVLAGAFTDLTRRDFVHAGSTLEAELALDARRYGDMPAGLSDRIVDRIHRLSIRSAELKQQLRRKQVSRFAWPVSPVSITSTFGKRFHPIHRKYKRHLGVDLEAREGQLVSAAGRGTVVSAGWSGAHGRHVVLRHADGVITRYSHLSIILVERGTALDTGDPVGLAGRTGRATGPHLHFELWRSGRPLDPVEVLPPPNDEHAPVASAVGTFARN